MQDSFIKKSDFEQTNLEVMLRFYEFFDPKQFENTDRPIESPTVVEEKEIAQGHYEKYKYDPETDTNQFLTPLGSSEQKTN